MLAIIENACFSYTKGQRTINSLSLSVDKGEILGLAGHNGAGKTTILKIIAGLLMCQQGQVKYEFFGSNDRRISYVPDQGGFYEELSGIENLVFRGEIAGMPDCRSIGSTFLETVGLDRKKNERAKTYSHGMKKRLAIACACMPQPLLLLLDESLNGVDPESRDEILSLLKKLKGEGVGIVISTHDLKLIEDLCDRVAIVQDGKLLFNEKVSQVNGDIRNLYRKIVSKDKSQ